MLEIVKEYEIFRANQKSYSQGERQILRTYFRSKIENEMNH